MDLAHTLTFFTLVSFSYYHQNVRMTRFFCRSEPAAPNTASLHGVDDEERCPWLDISKLEM